VLVDANTLLRTLQPSHPQRETARAAIKSMAARGRDLHIVAQNLVELWVVAPPGLQSKNGLGMTPAAVAMELTRIKSMFDLLRETPAIYPVWETGYSLSGWSPPRWCMA
jgi:hypothetical protein